MTISVGGLISGMDTEKMISQLQEIQKKPITQLQTKEAAYQVKFSAYSSLQGSLKDVKNAAKNLDSALDITSYSATSSNTSFLTAMVNSTAEPGSYSVKVNSLATAHKLTSAAFTSTEAVGKGTIHLKIGDNEATDILVTNTSTIANIAQSINDADAGIYASVVTNGTDSYLALTGRQTGADNDISLTVTEDGTNPEDAANLDTTGLSRLAFISGSTENMSETQQAKDADITVDGVQNIKRSSNTISDVISGVTLRLKGEGTSTVEVERSDEIFTTRMNAFVNAYNGLVTTLGSLQSYDKQTQATGTLFGDATTQRIQSQMKNLISNSVSGVSATLGHLTDLGITTDESGKLVLDSAVFSEQLESNYEDVVKFFTKTDSGSEGFAVRMATALDKILDTTNGTLAVRTKGIQTSIDSIEKQVEKLNKTMTLSETRLRIQFSSLEVLLGQYQNTSNSLTSNLDALSNGWGTGN